MNEQRQKDNKSQNNQQSQKPAIFEAFPLLQKDSDIAFALKKGQRLTGAIYMVTNYLADSEPLKWSLRQYSNNLLSQLISVKDTSSSKRQANVETIKKTALDIVSRLEVAAFAGLISEMNCAVFRSEFKILVDFLESEGNFSSGPVSLSSKLFEVDRPEPQTQTSTQSYVPQTPQTPNYNTAPQPTPQTTPTEASRPIENTSQQAASVPNYGTQPTESNGHKGPKPGLKNKKNARRMSIVNIVREKGKVSIKDVSKRLKNCSEKTVQREISALVDQGVLKKEGERRWSRYSLNE